MKPVYGVFYSVQTLQALHRTVHRITSHHIFESTDLIITTCNSIARQLVHIVTPLIIDDIHRLIHKLHDSSLEICQWQRGSADALIARLHNQVVTRQKTAGQSLDRLQDTLTDKIAECFLTPCPL